VKSLKNKENNFYLQNQNLFKPIFFFINMKIGRKITGGKYVKRRKKKMFERARQPRVIKLSSVDKRKKIKGLGGNEKVVLLTGKTINVTDLKSRKTKKVEIKNVVETPSNRFLARQNILIKGAIVQTELGKVRITNRPTQEGIINGVMVE